MPMLPFRRMPNKARDSKAYRRDLGHAEGMGIHQGKSVILPSPRELQQVTFHVWHVADRSMISAIGVYARGETGEQIRTNIGADILDYRIMDLPSLPQIVWAIGDEIRAGYKELSHPKA